MGKVKVSHKFHADQTPYITAKGRAKRGDYCRACGKPLKDEVSKQRGYGPECWIKIPVVIVLDIQQDKPVPS
jgi:hypothetical protein